jgi:methionyl-tRNA formyltransferase
LTAIVGYSKELVKILEKSKLIVSKVVFSSSPQLELLDYCKINKIENCTLDHYLENPDSELTILFECNRLIPKSNLLVGKWLNIHSGILPFWRGYNANSWAILNDYPLLGLSIHEVTEKLDDGPILKVIQINNDYKSSFKFIKDILINQLSQELAELVSKYLSGALRGIPQVYNLSEINYCARLKKEDGVISDFKQSSRQIINLFRVFSGQNESDFYIKTANNIFRVVDIRDVGNVYSGPPGRALLIEDNKVMIKTLNGSIWVDLQSTEEALLLKSELS